MAYLYGDGLHAEAVSSHVEADDAGFRVDGFRLVEDEVADAVVDGAAVVGLNGLQGVGVVAHEDVGSGPNEAVGLKALARHGLQGMLTAPMQADDDDCGRVGLSQSEDAL